MASPSKQKVHVTLLPEVCRSPQTLQATLSRIESATGLISRNPRRVERYGILSGEISPACIPQLKAVEGVQSVELDQLKRAL